MFRPARPGRVPAELAVCQSSGVRARPPDAISNRGLADRARHAGAQSSATAFPSSWPQAAPMSSPFE